MKNFFVKLSKTLLIFIISTIIIYLVLTLRSFFLFCQENQIDIFNIETNIINLDADKIQMLGDGTRQIIEGFENSVDTSQYENDGLEHTLDDGHTHSLAEFYDPLGFTLWLRLQQTVANITTEYITVSLFLGVASAVAYLVITSKKLNNILKFVIGYIVVIIIVPPLYMYSWTYRFWSIPEMYLNSTQKYFYIVYTLIFIVMYIVNYSLGKKMTKDLNDAINKTKE